MRIPLRCAASAFALAITASLTGCQPVAVVSNYGVVSTHTLKIAPDKDADVVWVQQLRGEGFVLMRCFNSPEGPACVKVKTP